MEGGEEIEVETLDVCGRVEVTKIVDCAIIWEFNLITESERASGREERKGAFVFV